MNVAAGHSPLGQQGPDGSVAGKSEQQMLGLDHRSAEHPRLVASEQDQIVRLVGECAQDC